MQCRRAELGIGCPAASARCEAAGVWVETRHTEAVCGVAAVDGACLSHSPARDRAGRRRRQECVRLAVPELRAAEHRRAAYHADRLRDDRQARAEAIPRRDDGQLDARDRPRVAVCRRLLGHDPRADRHHCGRHQPRVREALRGAWRWQPRGRYCARRVNSVPAQADHRQGGNASHRSGYRRTRRLKTPVIQANDDGCAFDYDLAGFESNMNIETLHIGMKVRHPQYGGGVVKSLTAQTAEIAFDDAQRTIAPASSDLQPAETTATLSELQMPLTNLIRDTAHAVVEALGLEKGDVLVEGLATRWQRGTLVMQPADSSLQPKEVPLETFFHKIVMIRNNLRVLEQKVNASDKLSDADKFDLQQYITRCYGSLTTFNILFKNKDDQFRKIGRAH